MKFGRRWDSPTTFWRHWNAKACRYRFVLMEANTRGDTPVVSLIAFNDSIRVLSPLCQLVSVQIRNHNPHRKKTRNIYCRHPASFDYKLPVIGLARSKYLPKSKDSVLFWLDAKKKRVRLHGCLLFSVDALFSPCHFLCWDPSGDIYSPFAFPEGDGLIYCMHGVAFWKGNLWHLENPTSFCSLVCVFLVLYGSLGRFRFVGSLIWTDEAEALLSSLESKSDWSYLEGSDECFHNYTPWPSLLGDLCTAEMSWKQTLSGQITLLITACTWVITGGYTGQRLPSCLQSCPRFSSSGRAVGEAISVLSCHQLQACSYFD